MDTCETDYVQTARDQMAQAYANMTPEQFRCHALDVAEFAARSLRALNLKNSEALELHELLAEVINNNTTFKGVITLTLHAFHRGKIKAAIDALSSLEKTVPREPWIFDRAAYQPYEAVDFSQVGGGE